ncbi:exo-alpha-sialidase, partial [Kitasatospora sp. NPDC001574]
LGADGVGRTAEAGGDPGDGLVLVEPPDQFLLALRTDDADPVGLYFGTRTGEVYASHDEGEHWSPLVSHLPDVLCVRAAVVAD